MAENEEHKPFMAFSFNEDGEFDRNAGIYLHVPLPKPPTGEEIAIMVGTIKTFAKTWRKVTQALEQYEAPPSEAAQPLPVDRGTAPTEPPREEGDGPKRPLGGATEAQCKKILAVCHRLDDKIVTKTIEGYPSVEWRLDKDGHCLPNWDFLRSLTVQKASTIIERLERAEA